MAKGIPVDYESLGPGAKEQVRRLYAVPTNGARPSPKAPPRKSFQERSAPARGRMRDRKLAYGAERKNVAQRRTRGLRAVRGAGRRTIRFGKGVHRAAGSPGGAIAGAIGLFIGGGILIAIVRTPAIITTPLKFIGNIMRAFTSLMNAPAAKAPAQNVGTGPKG